MAEYERGNGVVKTKDFTDNALVNFEPAFNILGDDEDYIKSVEMRVKSKEITDFIMNGYNLIEK